MAEFEFSKKKKKEKIEGIEGSDLFEELDVDLDSDHPVHEKFVDDKRLKEMKKKRLVKE
jgi:hypothetical protein